MQQCNYYLAFRVRISQKINSELFIRDVEVEYEKEFVGTTFQYFILD